MLRILPRRVLTLLVVVGAAGCGGATGPDSGGPPPVAVPEVEIRTLPSSNPNPDYDVTCQTGAVVVLKGGASSDPRGQRLLYVWQDAVDGVLTADLLPHPNPVRVEAPDFGTGFFTIGVHDVTLTVIAQDGRRGSATIQVLVTACEECGGSSAPGLGGLVSRQDRR